MKCCVTDLTCKEVICKVDGRRLGHVCDVDVDTCTGHVVALIIHGKSRCFGLLGRDDDTRICWDEIDVIGDDTILVNRRPERPPGRKKKKAFWDSFIR
ncbi:MAG: YlmC/YmxH family sporulation protein [Clostridiales bacterium]|nr:YlmC/YmxH family sporulation protein [Clostridiales bacterium]